MSGKWLELMERNGETDLGAALVRLARRAAEIHEHETSSYRNQRRGRWAAGQPDRGAGAAAVTPETA